MTETGGITIDMHIATDNKTDVTFKRFIINLQSKE
jgi:hypothetical protein